MPPNSNEIKEINKNLRKGLVIISVVAGTLSLISATVSMYLTFGIDN